MKYNEEWPIKYEMIKFHSTGEGGTADSYKPPVIDKTMAKRIATQLGWAPIDNKEWKYNPMTGEPLIDGWPLYSGLPQNETIDPQNQGDFGQKILKHEGNIQISDKVPAKSLWMEGFIMNQEYTPGEADAWINGHRTGKKQGEQLRLAVKEFFDKYLDVVEESDSGRMFNPIQISCCRAMKLEPLDKLLVEMRKLSGANSKEDYTS